MCVWETLMVQWLILLWIITNNQTRRVRGGLERHGISQIMQSNTQVSVVSGNIEVCESACVILHRQQYEQLVYVFWAWFTTDHAQRVCLCIARVSRKTDLQPDVSLSRGTVVCLYKVQKSFERLNERWILLLNKVKLKLHKSIFSYLLWNHWLCAFSSVLPKAMCSQRIMIHYAAVRSFLA